MTGAIELLTVLCQEDAHCQNNVNPPGRSGGEILERSPSLGGYVTNRPPLSSGLPVDREGRAGELLSSAIMTMPLAGHEPLKGQSGFKAASLHEATLC